MATEKFTNRAETTLNGAIDNSTTSVVVTSASTFPSSGQFRIVVNSEIMLVTSVSSNTFTVTRGAESTSAVSHTDASVVTHIITASALDQFRSDNIMCGTYANLPAAEKAGRIYLPTDSPYTLYDNGSSWVATINGIQCTIPNAAAYTWVNQSVATTSTAQGYTFLSALSTTTTGLHVIKKSLPNSTSYTITAGIMPLLGGPGVSGAGGTAETGFVLATSGGNQLINFGPCWRNIGNLSSDNQPVFGISIFQWSTATTATGFPYLFYPPFLTADVWWFRITDNGTTRKYLLSIDGINFSQLYSETHATFITPDQYGFFIDTASSSMLMGQSIVSIKETSP